MRLVTLQRTDRFYPDGYWDKLVGLDVRIPAFVEGGKVIAGKLVAATETETEITLTFDDLAPE